MFFNSVNRLIRRYRETRMYVTEVLYTANKEPRSLYSFIAEYNMEIELPISSIIKTKNIRSRTETMYLVHLSRGHNLLLFLDHRRGNHYAYCQKDTFDFIVQQYIHSIAIVHPDANTLVAASDQFIQEIVTNPSQEINLSTVHNKIIIIDSQILSTQPTLLDLLIQNNEIIVSPYYMDEIQAYTSNMTEYTQLITMIEALRHQNSGKLQTDIYLDPNANALYGINPSDEFEYMLGIAMQQPVTKSQILIITYNEILVTKAKLQSFQVYIPELVHTQFQSSIEQKTLESREFIETATNSELPPRSKRHQKSSVTNSNNLPHTIRTFFF